MYSIAAIALLADDGVAAEGSGGCVFKSAPTMKKSVPIPIAEMNSDNLRPSVSTRKNTKMAVAISLTMP